MIAISNGRQSLLHIGGMKHRFHTETPSRSLQEPQQIVFPFHISGMDRKWLGRYACCYLRGLRALHSKRLQILAADYSFSEIFLWLVHARNNGTSMCEESISLLRLNYTVLLADIAPTQCSFCGAKCRRAI